MAFFLILFVLFTFWFSAFVGVTLWGWFVTETFGITTITIPQFIGLSLLSELVRLKFSKKEKKSVEDDIHLWLYFNISITFILFIGWITHKFV